MPSPERITIELSNAEALVLFEFLHRFDDENTYLFADHAEERVLGKLGGSLETQLEEILSHEYIRLLAETREQVRDPLARGGPTPIGRAHAPIYLDYNATTPLDPLVVEAMLPYLRTHFGKPK